MRALLLAPLLLAIGCGQSELNPDAYNWDVLVTGVSDECNSEPQAFSEGFTYSLTFEGSNTNVAIGWDTFATGRISGCSMEYESPVVGEDRPGGVFVQWRMSGEAFYRQGGDTCSMSERVREVYDTTPDLDFDADWEQRGGGLAVDEVDWIGVETFEIVNVLDAEGEASDAFPLGCNYTTLVTGSYTGRGGE